MSRAGISTKDLIRLLQQHGWRVVETRRGNHWQCYSPDGKHIVPLATSDDWHAQRNNLTKLRRAGFVIEHDGTVRA